MDCGRAGWTDDLHFSSFAAQRNEIGRVRVGFDGNPGIQEWETKTVLDPGRIFQCEPVQIDRLSPCGRVDPKTENAVGHERFTARESFAHCGGRAGLDGDEHLVKRRHRTRVIHTLQLVRPCRIVDTTGLHHDFEETGNVTRASTGLRVVQDRSQGGACCSFAEIENEIHDEKWCEFARLGARRFLAQRGSRDADRLEKLECDGAFATGNGEDTQKR